TTETVTFKTGAGPHTGTFTGPTLWSLLNTVGLQTPAVKNGALRQFVVAEGSDGYTAVFSLGELNPNFGGSNPQVLVAYQENSAPLGSTGFARTVAAKDDFAAGTSPTSQISRSELPPPIRPKGVGRQPVFLFRGRFRRRGPIPCRPSR